MTVFIQLDCDKTHWIYFKILFFSSLLFIQQKEEKKDGRRLMIVGGLGGERSVQYTLTSEDHNARQLLFE